MPTSVLKNSVIVSFFIIISAFLYFYKLDYEYFFVDEVVYTTAGLANFKGDYSLSREVAPIGKYLAGLSALLGGRNVFLLRIPFTFLAIVSSLFVYLIIKDVYGFKYALLGTLLFLASPFIHISSRMVMLESVTHFFWLLFHLFFLRLINTRKNIYAVFTGVALGLSLATKVNSFILLPFFLAIFLISFKLEKTSIYKLMYISISCVVTYLIAHAGLIFKEGISGLALEFQNIKDKYFAGRNEAGKAHVVNGVVYEYSPWWYYFYYLRNEYPAVNLTALVFSPFVVFFRRNAFVIYWTIFFVIDFGFFQLLDVKASRYISSIEIPLVFLFVSGVYEFVRRFKSFGFLLGCLLAGVLIFSRISYLVFLQPTKYSALKTYLEKETRNFTTGDRAFIFGSIRSGRWIFEEYTEDAIPKPVVVRKDLAMVCKYPDFKYLVVDRDERLKDKNHPFFNFLNRNLSNYTFSDVGGLNVYIRKDNKFNFVLDYKCDI